MCVVYGKTSVQCHDEWREKKFPVNSNSKEQAKKRKSEKLKLTKKGAAV
jgi:hypothetical protein